MDKITTYCGKLIEQMTREELIDALSFFVSQLTAEREEHARQLDVLIGRTAPKSVRADGATGFCQCDTGYSVATHPICGICGLPRY